MNFNPGNQLLRVKRLGDIIAGALFQPLYLSLTIVHAGQNNDGDILNIRPCFKHAQKFKAIDSRHFQIAQNDVHWRREQLFKPSQTVLCFVIAGEETERLESSNYLLPDSN